MGPGAVNRAESLGKTGVGRERGHDVEGNTRVGVALSSERGTDETFKLHHWVCALRILLVGFDFTVTTSPHGEGLLSLSLYRLVVPRSKFFDQK